MSSSLKSIKLPKVAIIGRVNVGKSTLFNRLTENKDALVSKIAGTTRDRKYGEVIWRGQKFEIIDTGGLEGLEKVSTGLNGKNKLIKAIQQQIEQALKEATVVIFLVDAKEGPLPPDKQLALNLRKINKPVLLVVNKVDQQKFLPKINEFYELGCGEPLPISAANGSGLGDLLDQLFKILPDLPAADTTDKEKEFLRLALIGKPNVGKSSLINAILGEERVIVNELPHTTREPQDTLIEYKNNHLLLIDTAGIRKKSKINSGLESKGVAKSIKAIQRAEVAVLIIEAQKPLGTQEKHLTQIIGEAGCGVIIAANKWDLIEDKKSGMEKEFIAYFQRHFPYLVFAPIVFISAKTGQRVKKILDIALEIKEAREKIISDKELENFLKQIVKIHRPARGKGVKHPYIYGLRQSGTKPPTFVLTVNKKDSLHFSYLRFLENRLREEFNFVGTPIRVMPKDLK